MVCTTDMMAAMGIFPVTIADAAAHTVTDMADLPAATATALL